MKLKKVLPFAKKLLETAITSGDVVVDATLGNGHDSVFLANLVGEHGHVFSFDIQEKSLINSHRHLEESQLINRVTLLKKGHEHLSECIPSSHHGKITAAIFNLGYLPGGDKSIVTKPATTISAVKQLLSIMAPEGIIVIVIYHGHVGGVGERDSLLQYVKTIDQKKADVLRYDFINQVNSPPFIIAIEKKD
ncbi:16S rRNA (cytosine(1402)-N(4))-methyltransferase [Bacillus sp. V3B]|uniref:class I SAM-dependent methyltransferase n=1 Tax=Bacillus sp. V3B TaxID=2804915 RepID=UPI00210987D0|nr:class I SAM-dependent methyltransferase [Bacillus sp. V3B]MCQ6274447.1 16S rRNA (cytosine(1402)-N(4))-methyltransferase [Bacillus sp. V3B]